MEAHTVAVQTHIENDLNYALSAFQDKMCLADDDAIDLPPPPTTTTTTTTTVTDTAAISPAEVEKERNITFETNCIRSQGKQFEFKMPSTHAIIHKNYKSRLTKKATILDSVRLKMQQKQHSTDSAFAQTLWSVAFAACPALALSAAQCLTPLFFWAFLHDTGAFDFDTFDQELFAKSFPSDTVVFKGIRAQSRGGYSKRTHNPYS